MQEGKRFFDRGDPTEKFFIVEQGQVVLSASLPPRLIIALPRSLLRVQELYKGVAEVT